MTQPSTDTLTLPMPDLNPIRSALNDARQVVPLGEVPGQTSLVQKRNRNRRVAMIRKGSAAEAIKGLEPGGVDVYGLTAGQFSLLELIEAVLDVTGPAELALSTWTAAPSDGLKIKELLDAGVNVAYGQDCLKDAFYPTFGRADMLEVGLITAHAAQFSTPAQIRRLFDMTTVNAARILGLDHYGLEEGDRADFVILDCETVQEAFRLQPPREVYRRGRLLARTQRSVEIFTLD